MERYFWSINDKKYSEAEPIRLKYGERVRFKFVNETMMTHPMHLHGMWTILDNGNGKWNPLKHTVSIAPGTTVFAEVEDDAPGQWAFHRSEEHTSELQSLMRISYAVFCLKKKKYVLVLRPPIEYESRIATLVIMRSL